MEKSIRHGFTKFTGVATKTFIYLPEVAETSEVPEPEEGVFLFFHDGEVKAKDSEGDVETITSFGGGE